MSIEKSISEAVQILTNINEDQSVPRNIRRAATQSLTILADEEMEINVRAVNAIELLEETTGDPNCPYHARTLIWQAITRLELPREGDDDEYEYYDDEDEEWEDDEEEVIEEEEEEEEVKEVVKEEEDDIEVEWDKDFDDDWADDDDDEI